MSGIKENLEKIQKQIIDAEKNSKYGQKVSLVAVSKTHPVEDIQEAYNAGIRDFGENKVQELLSKIDFLPDDIRWHLIGHLQRNKVKQIIGKTYLIHSVDSIRLAEEIDKESQKAGVYTSILLEVNISGEESKYGAGKNEAIKLAEAVSLMKNVRCKGLMTVAPQTDDPEEVRTYFSMLRELSIDIESRNIDNISMDFLSMGMSGDFLVAINEGANIVRIGTSIFGARNYNIK